ncbi:MAG TPA: DEAD/DEAH box helicase [Anaerolineaceae bacterium]|jgi:ATP-dependent RNA helicase DeaD
MMLEFKDMGLQPQLMQAVEDLGFEQPTPIQQSAIPALLEGRNVMGQAQTGTGKTAAFVLPMLQRIEPGKKVVQALIMAPTRELAIQVSEAATRMAGHTKLRVLTVYGGQAYSLQTRELARGVDVVVGTPGRLLDLIHKEVLDLSHVRFLVLDEADEMLEMGFIEDVETIMAEVPAERQMALFSATLPDAVRKLAKRYMADPVEFKINPSRVTVAETEQRFCRVREENKMDALIRLMEVEEVKSALIFARTKARAQDIADGLIHRGLSAESLHGDLSQARREYVLGRFRQGGITLLVATDVAARGLDIEDISHVFNFDAPGDGEGYVHRIGRTGRAGRKGIAVTFICPSERGRMKAIEAYTHQSIPEVGIPNRDDILARRDERFIQRLADKLGKGSISHERDLIAKLMSTSFDAIEIAAAAIQLARAGEGELPIKEIQALPAEREERVGMRAHPRDRESASRGTSPYSASPRSKNPKWTSKEMVKEWRGDAVAMGGPNFPHSSKKIHGGEAGMVRLRMNLGVTQGLRPSDVVGAIASEVGIPGRAIGQIDIHENHTFVDVAEIHVNRVLEVSSGQYSLRGKAVLLTLAN